MPKTQKEVAAEQTRQDRRVEQKQDQRKIGSPKTAVDRVAAALPNMPGPKPGGLAEAMADPARLAKSLEDTRQRRENYDAVKEQFGIKDTRMPANTPSNKINYALGQTAKPHDKITIDGNPRFKQTPAATPDVPDKK